MVLRFLFLVLLFVLPALVPPGPSLALVLPWVSHLLLAFGCCVASGGSQNVSGSLHHASTPHEEMQTQKRQKQQQQVHGDGRESHGEKIGLGGRH